MPKPETSRWGRGIGALAIGMALWLALSAGACERDQESKQDGESAATSSETTTPGTSESESDPKGTDSATTKGVLPGDEDAGERQPKRVGPRAPALFVMTGLKGYLEPCGCTADILLGGAERVTGYVQAARKLYSDVAMVDGGDLFFETKTLSESEAPQAEAKVEVLVDFQKALGTRWTVPGERDFALGVDRYRSALERAGIEPLGANMALSGEALEPSAVATLGDWDVRIIGLGDPSLYEGVDGVKVTDPDEALTDVLESKAGESGATVLLWHGELKGAKELLRTHPGVDFAVVGHGPRETDQVAQVDQGFTLEPYDQGRYVGILSLYGSDQAGGFVNASTGSETELEQVNNQIEHVQSSLEKLRAKTPKDAGPTPLAKRLRERLDGLKQRQKELTSDELEIPGDARSFVWNPVAMKPGFPVEPSIRRERVAYNERLEELSRQVERTIPPVPDGEPTYIGSNQCASCHGAAHEFWKGTEHAGAVQTLKKRDKLFDTKCVGCHVVGYEEPGGSVLGKWRYDEEVDGETITKDLRNVGCESCHGPGSHHWRNPVGSDGRAQHIVADPGESTCKTCHVPEHSPSFEFPGYVRQVTGSGHALDDLK